MMLRNMHLVGRTQNSQMPQQHRAVFEEGCALAFSRWMALQLAVNNEWGGSKSREKAQELLEEVVEWFFTKKGAQRAAPSGPPERP